MDEFVIKDKSVPKCRQIKDHIKGLIQEGRFQGDEKFPTEREWMAKCGVSRFTVRAVLGDLAREGLLVRARRKGTSVCAPPAESGPRNRTASNQIGILVPNVTYLDSVGMVRAIEDVCSEKGFHLVLRSYDATPEKERQCLDSLANHGVSGFVVFPSYNSFLNDYYEVLQKRDIPLVFIDSPVEGVLADTVATDSFHGAYEGMRALVASGCRKVAFLSGDLSASTSRARLSGCLRALAEQGIAMGVDLVRSGAFTREFGCEAARGLLAAHKDLQGFFVANEPLTVGVLKAVREMGLGVPGQIRICSFDEPHHSLDYTFPMILVRQPRYETGKKAAEILFERIREKRDGKAKAPAQTVLLKAEVVVPPEYSGSAVGVARSGSKEERT